LHIGDNNITALPPHTRNLQQLRAFPLHDNPMTYPPHSVTGRGMDATLAYLMRPVPQAPRRLSFTLVWVIGAFVECMALVWRVAYQRLTA